MTAALSIDWSLALDAFGETAEGLADVAQAVRVILTAPLGSDPHRPDFGCDLPPWIDRPVSASAPGIAWAVRDALEKWERRIEIVDVVVSQSGASSGAGAGVSVAVTWRLTGTIAAGDTTVVVVGQAMAGRVIASGEAA